MLILNFVPPGVAACDIDGDGKEEIYFLNTNQAYAGRSAYGDKIFKWRDGKYVDLYSDTINANMPAKGYAGRSVACVDRKGTGRYAFVVATYSSGGDGEWNIMITSLVLERECGFLLLYKCEQRLRRSGPAHPRSSNLLIFGSIDNHTQLNSACKADLSVTWSKTRATDFLATVQIAHCLIPIHNPCFAGRFALIEMNDAHPANDVSTGRIVLRNVATEAGIDRSTGKDFTHKV